MNIYRNVFSEVKDYFDNEGFIEFFTDIINGKLPPSIDPQGDLVPKILSSLRNKFPKETQQRFNKDGFIDFLKKKRRALAKAFANKHGLDEKNTDGVLDFYLSSISGSFPVNSASVNSYNKKHNKNIKFEDIKRDLKDLGMLTLFKSVYKKNDKNGGEVDLVNSDIQKSLKFFYELPGGEDPTSSSFKIFNKSNNSDITPEMYANIKNVIEPLYNLWNTKLKDKYSVIVKNKKPGITESPKKIEKDKNVGFGEQPSKKINVKDEFGDAFLARASKEVSKEEESAAVNVDFLDQFDNVLNTGDLFFIPQIKEASILEIWIKRAIEQDIANDRAKVWEEYGYPSYSSPKTQGVADETPEEVNVSYPKAPKQEIESKPESKEDLYIKYNTFRINKKFMREDPFVEKGEEKNTVPWVEGINTLNSGYKIRVPLYLISKIISFQEKKSEEYINEEIFIHEAIYESLLDLIKEAQDDSMEKPSQKVLSEGKVKAIDPETNEEMSLTKENNTIKVTPVAKEGDPSSSEYYDQNSPEIQELDNTLKAIR